MRSFSFRWRVRWRILFERRLSLKPISRSSVRVHGYSMDGGEDVKRRAAIDSHRYGSHHRGMRTAPVVVALALIVPGLSAAAPPPPRPALEQKCGKGDPLAC